jgi:hypothetical protein
MMKIQIKGGTPQHGESLCVTCQWAQIIRGFRESEELIICTSVYPNLGVAFAVRECTRFRSSVVPTPQQMESMALIIPVEPKRKRAGFAGKEVRTEAQPAAGE